MRLSRTLFLLVLLALALPVGLQVLDEFSARHRREAELRAAAFRHVQVAEAQLEQVVDGARRFLATLVQVLAVEPRDAESCSEFFAQIQQGSIRYRDLAVADRDGTITCASRPELVGISARDWPHFAAAREEGRFVVGTYATERIDGRPALPFAAPVLKQGGFVESVVVAAITLDWLAAHLSQRDLPPDAVLTVADSSGTILARLPEGERVRGQRLGEPYLPLLQARADGVIETADAQDRKFIVAYSSPHSAPQGLFVAAAFDKASFFAPLDRDTLRTAIGIALGALLAMAAAWSIAAYVVGRPIRRLAAAAGQWQQGDYAARAGGGAWVKEIGELGAVFDQLAGKLDLRERQLRAASDTKRRLLAAAGHDLRQPLQVLTFVIGKLGRLATGPAELRELARAEKALDRLTAALDTLVEAARLDSGAVQVRRRAILLGDLLGEIGDEWAAKAEAKGIDFRVVPTHAAVESDPALLRTVLHNLVGNAVKYTARGGVLIGCRRGGDKVRIEVVDTGIGIPPEKLGFVFAEFEQLDATADGFGLGLAIVQRTAELLGHPLTVRSEPGKGSRFGIEVPRAAMARTIAPLGA